MNKATDMLCKIYNLLRQLVEGDGEVDVQTVPVVRTGNVQEAAAENMNRLDISLTNGSTTAMFVGFSDDISENKYAYKIGGGNSLILSANNVNHLYKKRIYVFWDTGAASDSTCMVTETKLVRS